MIAGCPDIGPSNPYDPETPSAQQATGSVSGELVLDDAEGRYDPRLVFPTAQVWLYRAANAFEPFAGRPAGEDGRFTFGDIPAGDWAIVVELSGFAPASVSFDLAIAEDRAVGPIRLVPLDLDAPEVVGTLATVRGRARLEGQRDHGSVRVETPGWPYAAVTTSDGDWSLTVPPGRYPLRYIRAGFGTQVSPEVAVAAGDDVTVDEVVLPSLPGAFIGRVALAAYAHPERLAQATVELLDDRLQLVATTTPAADGDFAFDAVPAGPYVVRVACTGYITRSLPSEAMADGRTRLGTITLDHGAVGPDAVSFSGRLRLADAAEHGGTAVVVRIAPQGIPFARLVTDAAGRFSVPAARGDALAIAVERPGYVIPALPVALRWDEARAAFAGPEGPIDLVLARQPIDGIVVVPVEVGPAWLPERHRRVRVDLEGPSGRQSAAAVSPAAPARFTGLAAGTHRIVVSRDGFTTSTHDVQLDADRPEVELPPVPVELEGLAEADLDLAGESLDACALRASMVDFRFADLAGVELFGDFGSDPGCDACAMCDAFDLRGTNLSNASLQAARLAGVRLSGARLSGATALDADFTEALLDGASLVGARLDGALFVDTDLRDANLLGASLVESAFIDTARADVIGAPCGGERRLLLAGARLGQADLEAALLAGIDLSGATLVGARLIDAQARGACLHAVDLSGARLLSADLRGADLSEAPLDGAFLTEADLRGAELSSASLGGANLEGARLSLPDGCAPPAWLDELPGDEGVCLGAARWQDPACCRTTARDAIFTGANLRAADLRDVDLTDALMLDILTGESPGLAAEQPSACRPEAYGRCVALYDLTAACDDTLLRHDGAGAFVDECLAGRVRYGEMGQDPRLPRTVEPGSVYPFLGDGAIDCAVSQVPFGDCSQDAQVTFGQCLFSSAPPDEGLAEPPCTWPDIVEGRCPEAWTPPECVHRRTDLRRSDLTRARFENTDLRGTDLAGARVRGARLDGADLSAVALISSDLSELEFTDLRARHLRVIDADMSELRIAGTDLTGAHVDGVLADGLTVTDSDLSSSRWRGLDALPDAPVTLRGVDLSGAVIEHAILPGARLTDGVLDDTFVRGSDLSEATIEGRLAGAWFVDDSILTDATVSLRGEQGRVQLNGVEGAGMMLTSTASTYIVGGLFADAFVTASTGLSIRSQPACDLTGRRDRPNAADEPICADVRSAQMATSGRLILSNADARWSRIRAAGGGQLTDSLLACANLRSSDLSGGNLTRSDLRGADLSSVPLVDARLVDADMRFARLSGADLRGANFFGANLLRTASLGRATIGGTHFGSALLCSGQRLHVDGCGDCPDDGALYVDCSLDVLPADCRVAGCPGDDLCGSPAVACYHDRVDRDLPLLLPGDEWLPADCKRACFDRGHAFAGIQFGGVCFCGDDYGRHGEGAWDACLMPCRADPSQACGGDYHNLIMLSERFAF